ncbi:hypothetical protein B0T10DRAFT_488546, partial [Thelonectria olida]
MSTSRETKVGNRFNFVFSWGLLMELLLSASRFTNTTRCEEERLLETRTLLVRLEERPPIIRGFILGRSKSSCL